MRLLRSLSTHLSLLVASAALAWVVWTDEESDSQEADSGVAVWEGRPEAVESIAFESEKAKVKMHRRKDAHGRYYVVEVDKLATESPPTSNDEKTSSEAVQPKLEKKRLVSVEAAQELAELLVPLKAMRSIGRVVKDRTEEFGFDEPEGRLKLVVGGKTHELVIGGLTPGGGDYYAKVAATGQGYAIKGQIVRMLSHADARLVERELHKFEEGALKRVRVKGRAGAREFIDLEGKGWARAGQPKTKDETVGNWMTKIGRLNVTEYAEKLPPGGELVARVDYVGSSSVIGFLELHKVPGDKHPEFYVRTERTRWYGKVLQSVGSQVEQDLASVIQ